MRLKKELKMNLKRSSVDDFILENVDLIKSICTTKKTTSVNSVFENKVETKVVYNTNIINKWWQLLPDNLSNDFREILCFYCEVLYIYDQNYNSGYSFSKVDIKGELNRILLDISKKNNRSKIVDKYYNYNKNIVEYLLEDGNYIPVISKDKPIIKTDLSVFPLSFVKLIDDQEYRNMKIENII